MPGMKQLKKFSDDITQLGNELIRRQEKGETFPRVNFPEGISDADDSDDFVFGLPVAGQQPAGGNSGGAGASSSGGSDSSVNDILSSVSGTGGADEEPEIDIEALLAEARGETVKKSPDPAQSSIPDISLPGLDGVGGVSSNAADSVSKEIPEFSADNPFTLPGMSAGSSDIPDIDALLSGFADDVETPDIDINADSGTEPVSDDFLNNLASADFGSTPDFSENDFSGGNDDFEVQSAADETDPGNLFAGLDLPDFGAGSSSSEANSSAGASDDLSFGMDDLFSQTDASSDVPATGSSSDFETSDFDLAESEPSAEHDFSAMGGVTTGSSSSGESASVESGSGSDSADFGTDFSLPDFDLDNSAETGTATDDFVIGDNSSDDLFRADIGASSDFGSGEEPSATQLAETVSNDADSAGADAGGFDFDLPDFDMPSSDDSSAESVPAGEADESSGSSIFDDDDLFATPKPSSGSSSGGLSLSIDSEPESGSFELPPEDPFAIPESDGFNPEESSFSPEEASSFEMPEAPDFGDMSEFSMDAPDAGGMEGSFESIDNDFSIPGFSGDSDFDLIPPEVPEVKTTRIEKPTAKTGRKRKEKVVRERNELTEDEYATFRENLKGYPLNLRVALQEIIVNPDFTEEAIMKIIDMVISKTPARTLANYLEKESLVDYAIPVPANYEKRTVAEYEEYKKSLEYRLKNRIIPIAIISVISFAFLALFTFLIARFVVRPVKAEMLYSEGYTLIENGLYPQSEVKFNEAVYYKPKKSWFYKYARAYSDHKQYERASEMYERLIQRYDYEKKAGIEYARMELDELADYSKAEEITRRYVLDRHINDADGMLLLGDIFLEWATNNDSSKFEDARIAYADLMSLYGQTDLYLSRMMRYFIRTDQIREVLPLKNYFYPRLSKDPLEGQDLVELSGYLLDKLFGYLAPADEFLRTSIEDVRDLLEQAVKKAPEIPESTYNLGRYFVETGNSEAAEAVLAESLGIFAAAEKKTHSRILRNINAYRLIGELKAEEQEYLESERMYVAGIDMYTSELKRSGLKSDENVGILYSDLADLDYFISGDLDSALQNYQYSVDNHNDTASIRYKMGYINYVNGDTGAALDSFIKTITDQPSERNTLFALGNTLVMRESTSAAQGYYEKLIDLLDREKETAGVLYPQLREEQGSLVDLYMKTANNLGVTLSRLAKRNSNSMYNARAMSLLTESTRAWDALTRNQTTMIRLEGTNLAAQNLKYMTVPSSSYEPEIYTAIPRVLYGEKMLSQPDIE